MCFLQGELLALQLPEKEADDAISAEILPLIGQSQSRDEERLADLDVRHTNLHLSFMTFIRLKNWIYLFAHNVTQYVISLLH